MNKWHIVPDDMGRFTDILACLHYIYPSWESLSLYLKHFLGAFPHATLHLIMPRDAQVYTLREEYEKSSSRFKVKFLERKLTEASLLCADHQHLPFITFGEFPQDYIQVLTYTPGWDRYRYIRCINTIAGREMDHEKYFCQMLPCEWIANNYSEEDILSETLMYRSEIFMEGGDILSGILPNGTCFLILSEDIIYNNQKRYNTSLSFEKLKEVIGSRIKSLTGNDELIWIKTRFEDSTEISGHIDQYMCLAGWDSNHELQQLIVPEYIEDFCVFNNDSEMNILSEEHRTELEKYRWFWDFLAEELTKLGPVKVIRIPAVFHITGNNIEYLPHLNGLVEYDGEKTTLYFPDFEMDISDNSWPAQKRGHVHIQLHKEEITQKQAEMIKRMQRHNIHVKFIKGGFQKIIGSAGFLRCRTKVMRREMPEFLKEKLGQAGS